MTRDFVGSRPVSAGEMPLYSFLEWLDETPLHDWQKDILKDWENKLAPEILEYIVSLQDDPISDIELDFEELIDEIKNVC